MPTLVTAAVAAAATALACAGVVVVHARRRREGVLSSAQAEVDALRARGLAEAERERQAILAEGRRKAATLRQDTQILASEAAAEFDAEDQRLAARESVIERRRTELDERSREIDGQFDALRHRTEALDAASAELPRLATEAVSVVERAAHQTRDETQTDLRSSLVEQARLAAQKAARLCEETARANAEQSARQSASRRPSPCRPGRSASDSRRTRTHCCARSPRRPRSSFCPRPRGTTSTCRPRTRTLGSGRG
jgi:hypothetical protein